jgi:hypothetical protein
MNPAAIATVQGLADREWWTWFVSLVTGTVLNSFVPLTILGFMVIAFWSLMVRAEAIEGFTISDILRDETGKVSMSQVLKLGAFLFMSFAYIVVIYAHPDKIEEMSIIYGGTFGPTVAALEFIRRKWPTPVPAVAPAQPQPQPGDQQP